MAFMPRVYHPNDFVKIFVPTTAEKERAIRKGADPGKLTVVPTLALDSVIPSGTAGEIKQRFGLPADARPIISLMAGSRPSYAALSIDFMLDIAGCLLCWGSCRSKWSSSFSRDHGRQSLRSD